MISKKLSLPENKRLDSIYVIKTAKELLSYYNSNYRSDEDKFNIDYRLLDRYPTFYKLIRLINYRIKYTQSELLMIANLVYSLKGSIQSIIKFCKYFDIELVQSNVDYVSVSYSVDLNLDNVESDNQSRFEALFKMLVSELLLTGVTEASKLKISIKSLVQDAELINTIHTYVENEIVNYIHIKSI